MTRPTGVTILAVLDFIGAAGCVLLGILFMVGGTFAGAAAGSNTQGGAAAFGFLAGLGAFMGVAMFIGAAIAALVGWGLWKLKGWARIVTIVLAALGAAVNLLGIVTHFNVGGLIGLAIDGLILWYMFQPNVKAAFAGSSGSAAMAAAK